MLITIVTEFPSKNFFQWSKAWNEENQRFNNCLIKEVMMSRDTYNNFSTNSPYWDNIRKADVVFVYCTRFDMREGWQWWKLPFLVRPLMRPNAKMIVQFDDEFVDLFHRGWMWWKDDPYKDYISPEQFFQLTGILQVGDMYWTVLDNPEWKQYCKKPVMFMPLPHLTRHGMDMFNAEKNYLSNYPTRDKVISMMLHSTVKASVTHTVKNVGEHIDMPMECFTCNTSTLAPITTTAKFRYMRNLKKDEYMMVLRHSFAAIDDNENYIGWSRFAMECAINFVPCIGSTYAVKTFFPDLYTEPKDYAKQLDLIEKLKDEKFYDSVVYSAHDKLTSLSVPYMCEMMAKEARKLLNGEETQVDINYELFMDLIQAILSNYTMPPMRPLSGMTVYDSYYNKTLDTQAWDKIYGNYASFMSSEDELRKNINEALDRNMRRLQ